MRGPLLLLVVGVIAAVALCFVPLFSLLGYESSAAMGAVLGVGAVLSTLSVVDRAVPGPLADGRGVAPTRDFVWLLAVHLAVAVVPMGVLLLDAVRVKNCDPLMGVRFWLVIPMVSVVAGQALAWAVAAAVERRRRRVIVALAVVGAEVGWLLWKLGSQPPITGHEWFIGWFAGSIYDEALSLPSALRWSRLLLMVEVAAVVMAVEAAWRRRTGRPVVAVLAGMLVAVGVGGTVWRQRAPLGFSVDRAYVVEQLGGELRTEHFVIHYGGVLDAEQRALLAEDHEFRYAELSRWFGVDPVAWRGRPIESFVYANRAEQERLMGSRGTLVARPWTHEMHIRWSGYGDHILAHELAHLFTAPFGGGPLQLATRGGLLPDIGLVEGVAVAADWEPDELSGHQASAALRRLGMAPDLRRAFAPWGFWTLPGGRAYVSMGSFVRWLVDTWGIEAFRHAYRDGDWQGAYGAGVDQLVGQWEAFLDGLPLSDTLLEQARFRYRQGSIFQKVCARTMADLREQASGAERRGDFDRARRLRERIIELQPGNPDWHVDLAELLVESGDLAAAREVLGRLMTEGELPEVQRVRVSELLADVDWKDGVLEPAADAYEACLSAGLSDDQRRLLQVKSIGLASAPEVRDLVRRYVIDDTGGRLMMYLALQWAATSHDDPLPRYIVGVQLVNSGAWPDAVSWLDGPPGLLPTPELDEQRLLLLGQALFHSDRLDESAAAWQVLRHSQSSRVAALAEEWDARTSAKRASSGHHHQVH